jgi:hypothetical protein
MSSSNSDNSRSRAEVEHLDKLEAIVQRGLNAEIEVGNALAEINDTWLYRASNHTFETYLRDRWGMSRERADQLIQAAAAAGPPPSNGLARVWERARQEFGGDDVTAVEIHLTVHKRPQPSQLRRSPWQLPQDPDELENGELLRRLRWLMTESSGTIAHIAHQLETRSSELDDEAQEQLRDDVLVLDEDLATLKSLLLPAVDWDAEHGRLISGDIPPFEDESEDD